MNLAHTEHPDADLFYSQLPEHQGTLARLLASEELFNVVPEDWHVIITDIKNSTFAVMNDRHQTVNLIATGSIVTVLNIAFSAGLEIPFFFGGDGSTFIVPASIAEVAMKALNLYKAYTLTNFDLELRVGVVPVRQIYSNGNTLQIARFKNTSIFSIPVVLGNGLNYAEKIIKGADYLVQEYEAPEEELDLTGMQCRWDQIAPPDKQEEVVTLLVMVREGKSPSRAFSKMMQKIDEIYGTPVERQPISVTKLRLNTSFSRFSAEVLAKFGTNKAAKWLEVAIKTFIGIIYFRTRKGKLYLERLVAMSDTIVLDGKINTVMSGTQQQRKKLERFLEEMETAKEIVYGIFISNASMMSCYVRNMDDGHIHFVDGANGGYTNAAKMLKAKINEK
jgi:acylphosphatase